MNPITSCRVNWLPLICCLAWLWTLGAIPHSSALQHTGGPPLDYKLGPVRVHSVSIIDGLAAIRTAAPRESVIFSLEVVPFTTSPEKNLTVNLPHATVGQALKSIVTQDPRYTYEVISSHLIHVLPREAKKNSQDLLNVPVTDLRISAARFDQVLQYPNYFIPELQAAILRRSHSGGYATSMLGSADAPKVSVTLAQGTVRDVLNDVSRQTESLHDTAGYGWIYTFHIEKNNPLGGQPKWRVF